MVSKKLGNEQSALLGCLVEHKQWYGDGFGCGWNWGSTSKTQRILDSLVKRGLVETHEQALPCSWQPDRTATVYQATDTGQAYVATAKAARSGGERGSGEGVVKRHA